ncbi:MAG TPA: hypothetical protein VFV11_10150 [Solimonas sp.]|nr:hypothetical protein [Solimonas sp.]
MTTTLKLLRAIAVLLVLLLAGFACLFVLGVVPREVLIDGTVRLLAIGGICAAALFVIGLLVNNKPPQ